MPSVYLGPCRGPHIRVTFLLSFTIGTWGVWRYLHLTDRKGARILVELDCNRASLLPGLVVLESPLGLSGAWFSRGHRSTSLVSLSACKWALILPEPFDSAEDGCEHSGKRPGSITVLEIFSSLLPAAQHWCEDWTAFFMWSSHLWGSSGWPLSVIDSWQLEFWVGVNINSWVDEGGCVKS